MNDEQKNNMYPSASAAFDIIKEEYEYELNRSMKLDNKINITITFCGVIFLFIFKYLDFKSINSLNNDGLPYCWVCNIRMICVLSQIAIIVLFMYSIIMLISLLKPRGYLHINCDEIFDKKLFVEPVEITKYYISTKYLSATSKNNETNEIRSKKYNKVLFRLTIMLFLCILVEILKYNFLGLGV